MLGLPRVRPIQNVSSCVLSMKGYSNNYKSLISFCRSGSQKNAMSYLFSSRTAGTAVHTVLQKNVGPGKCFLSGLREGICLFVLIHLQASGFF